MKIKVSNLEGIESFMSMPGERLLVVLRPSWLYYIRYLIFPLGMTVLFGVNNIEIVFLSFSFWILLVVLSRFSNLFIITTHRAVEQRGLISRYTSEAFFANIQMIKLEQGIVDRLLGTGQIKIESAGQNGREGDIVFGGIADPLRVKEFVFRMKNKVHKKNTNNIL